MLRAYVGRSAPTPRVLLATALGVAAVARLTVLIMSGDVSHGANLWEYGEQGYCAWRTGGDLCMYYPGTGASYPSAYMPPMLSYLWLGLFNLFGDGSVARAAFLVGNLAAALGCVALLFHLSRKVWPSSWVAYAAAMLFALYPTFVFVTATYHQTNWAVLLLLAVIAIAVKLAEGGRPWLYGSIGGLLCGLAALNRSEMIVIGPVLIALGALWRRNPITLVKIGVASGLVMFLTIAPWAVRNYEEFGRVVPTAQSSGYNLWKGFTPYTNGSGHMSEEAGGPGDHEREAIRDSVAPGSSYEPRLQDAYEAVFENDLQAASVARIGQLTVNKVALLWSFDWTDREITGRLPYLLPWAAVNFLAVIGLLAAWRGRRHLCRAPAAICASGVVLLTAAYAITAVHARYRMHIEPFLFVLAAMGAEALWMRFVARRPQVEVVPEEVPLEYDKAGSATS